MELVTARLRLRELRDDDWEPLYEMERRPEVVRYLTKEVQSEADVREYVQGIRVAATEVPRMVYEWALTLHGDDRLIGRCGVRRTDTEPREGMLWYVVAPEHQGRGYAAEAARAVLGFAFEELSLHRVFADCDPRNPASARVMEKIGLRREAHLVENVWIKGEWCDSLIYALLRREWLGA